MTSLLSLRDVDVLHGTARVLTGISLEVAVGEIVTLLGANGAGKSTLLRAVMGLASVTGGAIDFDGRSLLPLSIHRRARRGIGYAPEGRRIFPGLTIDENLGVACIEDNAGLKRRIDEVLALFPPLALKRGLPGWQLSGGEQQMLAIGRALINRPRLLLLDEPSLGLSPVLVHDLLAVVRGVAAAGAGVLLAEQNVAQALEIANHGIVLRGGRVALSAPAAALRSDDRLKAAFLGGE
jgi:branched-chain amino acid transport system ATP-binding protein